MRLLLIILIGITFVGAVNGQQNQITEDFIRDEDGKLGLRSKYIAKVKQGKYGFYTFNGVKMSEYFTDKSKKEIFNLLGKPNHFIKNGHITKEEASIYGYDVDIIEYTIYYIFK